MLTQPNNARIVYYKCSDCLTAFTATNTPAECLCGGSLECLGPVQGTRYRNIERAPPCDGRCTNAQGPKCDCVCQGECHGTGRLVDTVVSEGVVKIRSMGSKGLEQGKQYRALLEQAIAAYNARHGEVNQNIASGVWVNRNAFLNARGDKLWLNRIKAGKQWKSRQAELTRYIEKLSNDKN